MEQRRQNAEALRWLRRQFEKRYSPSAYKAQASRMGIYIQLLARNGEPRIKVIRVTRKKGMKKHRILSEEGQLQEIDKLIQQLKEQRILGAEPKLEEPLQSVYLIEKDNEDPTKRYPTDAPAEEQPRLVEYSDKSIAVMGNTKPIKWKLKELGGRYNPYLRGGPGWVFPKSRKDEIRRKLKLD